MSINNANNFMGEVAQKGVIAKEGKVLLVRDPHSEFFDPPGGRIHVGERPADAVAREILEELGVAVTVERAFFADMWMQSAAEPAKARYFVAFACVLQDPDATFTLQEEEVAQVRWIGKDEVDDVPLFDICKRALKAYFAG